MTNQPNIVVIIQARMGSTRLPNKVLLPISGYPILWHVTDRANRAKTVSQVVVATSIHENNDCIEEFCRDHQLPCYRGSEDDVLDRFYQTATLHNADIIIRITADCPLIDSAIIDHAVHTLQNENADYASTVSTYTYPEGMDVEVFTFQALENAWNNVVSPMEREHVTTYIRNSNEFKHANVNRSASNPIQNSLSVDNELDYQLVKTIFDRLYPTNPHFGVEEVINYMVTNPELQKINAKNIINEGTYHSYVNEPAIEPKQYNYSKSKQLLKKAATLIPSCTQTFSKGYTQFVDKVSPNFAARAKDARFWDVDGNEFLEYTMGLGPILLGHSYSAVNEAVKATLEDGTIYSLPHKLEIEVSELITNAIPSAEMVRFGKNGSDVTSAAVRVTRAFTGRDHIVCCGYHGWQDWYIGTTTRRIGVPQDVCNLTHTFDYNNIESLHKLFEKFPNQIAAVIMEPVGLEEPTVDFLAQVKELTQKNGALLIFDEVITGFRLSLGGAQSHYDVLPDITCCGKAMGNGFPIASIAGRADIMQKLDEAFFSFTFGGETVSLSAAKAVIQELIKEPVHSHIWTLGKQLIDGLNSLIQYYELTDHIYCQGLPPRSGVLFHEIDSMTPILKSLFQQECMKRGLFFTSAQFISYSHTLADIDFTLRVYRSVLEIIEKAIDSGQPERWLEDKPVQPVFRRP